MNAGFVYPGLYRSVGESRFPRVWENTKSAKTDRNQRTMPGTERGKKKDTERKEAERGREKERERQRERKRGAERDKKIYFETDRKEPENYARYRERERERE